VVCGYNNGAWTTTDDVVSTTFHDQCQSDRHLGLFFFHGAATTEIYTLSLHDALPISGRTANACSSSTSTGRLPKGRPSPWCSWSTATHLKRSSRPPRTGVSIARTGSISQPAVSSAFHSITARRTAWSPPKPCS